ncbi:MAG: AbrB/MazE/SpoVT family DNA-binding domain-containing protein [Aggregatilineales bacterium]
MITQKLRKVGNSYVVTIPKEEVERRQLTEGQLLIIEIQPAEVRPVMSPEVLEAFERSWEKHEDAYRYLADH